jgi:hypothetical protein
MAELRASRLAAIPALVLVAVALTEIVATRRQAAAVPGDEAWARAAAVVRAGHRPGDLIVFAPDWADPIGRLHLGDLISLDMAGRMDAARYGRIWELAIRGAHARDVAGLVPVEERDEEGVAIRRYERTPAVILADVRDALATARTIGGVARLELAEVGFEPHRCILVVPPTDKPVRITFPRLALGSQLVGYVGLADVFTRRDVREPGTLAVELAGTVATTVTAGVDDGWVRFAVPTTPGAADVTFVISATRPGRQVCFAAEARQ